MIDVKATFDKFEAEFCQFERVEHKRHARPDLCAFLILDALVPNTGRDMVADAEHDEIFLDTDCKKLARVATEDDILMLVRCGVRYDIENECLAMFV